VKVKNQLPKYLRLHVEEFDTVQSSPLDGVPFEPLQTAFTKMTGWALKFCPAGDQENRLPGQWQMPIQNSPESIAGHLSIDVADITDSDEKHFPLSRTQPLAEATGKMLNHLLTLERSLWEREAELAAGIPMRPHKHETTHLAERLEAVLRGAAEAVQCQAAALYLLDDTTSQLKLRAAWRLPAKCYSAPARALRGAVADLEVLAGHAVVLEDTSLFEHWNLPTDYPCQSAICVPVSSPTTPLGTLWIFGNQKRDYSPRETNLVEIVAGRVACELEREVLISECQSAKRREQQWNTATQIRHHQLNPVAPLVEGWQVAATRFPKDDLGGSWHNWQVSEDHSLNITAGIVHGSSVGAAMQAASLQAVVQSHGDQCQQARNLIEQANSSLWMGSSGDQFASMFCGRITPDVGHLQFVTAGIVEAIVLRSHGWEAISQPSVPLGTDLETSYEQFRQVMANGETLVVLSGSLFSSEANRGRLDTKTIAVALHQRREATPQQLIEIVENLASTSDLRVEKGGTILVVKRNETQLTNDH